MSQMRSLISSILALALGACVAEPAESDATDESVADSNSAIISSIPSVPTDLSHVDRVTCKVYVGDISFNPASNLLTTQVYNWHNCPAANSAGVPSIGRLEFLRDNGENGLVPPAKGYSKTDLIVFATGAQVAVTGTVTGPGLYTVRASFALDSTATSPGIFVQSQSKSVYVDAAGNVTPW